MYETLYLLWTCIAIAVAQSMFSYTGGSQTYGVPGGINELNVTVCGASGSSNGGYNGGNGGCITCTITASAGTTIYVLVGGIAGYNGGGSASGDAVGGGNI